MTDGIWACLKCGHAEMCPIYDPLEVCPICSAKYEVYEVIHPHIVHEVIIQRLEGTDELNVVLPFVFCTSDRFEDIEKMDKIVNNVYQKIEQFSSFNTHLARSR